MVLWGRLPRTLFPQDVGEGHLTLDTFHYFLFTCLLISNFLKSWYICTGILHFLKDLHDPFVRWLENLNWWSLQHALPRRSSLILIYVCRETIVAFDSLRSISFSVNFIWYFLGHLPYVALLHFFEKRFLTSASRVKW